MTVEESKAQDGQVTCPRSHSEPEAWVSVLNPHVLASLPTKPNHIPYWTRVRFADTISLALSSSDTPDTPGSPEGNTEGPGTASSEPLLPS